MQLGFDATRPPELVIEVSGPPMPQGSKDPRITGERVRVRGRVAVIEPRVMLVEVADAKTTTSPAGRLTAWRRRVHQFAWRAWRDAHEGRSPDPWDGPIELGAEFVIPRPEGDWLAPGKLRPGAREWPCVRPDLGKLVRAIEDSLSGVVYSDDARIVRYSTVEERYAAYGGAGGVRIRVRPL